MNKLIAAATTLLMLTPSARAAEPAKAASTPAAANRAPSRPAPYDSFRLIHTRNVFDPDRRPIRPPGSGAPVSVTPTLADYAALTGTMVSPEKTYAFFSGSRPDFNKVLTVHDKFTNATIEGITPQSIEIERDGKRTTILIGQTVPFDNQTAPGEPPVEAAPTEISSGASAPAAAGSTPAYNNYYRQRGGGNNGGGGNNNNYGNRGANAAGTPAPTPSGPPGNVDEIRRRMMEKRQQELK